MGFADKLRSTLNKVTDSVQSGLDPLPDETSKKYYEIAYGLLSSVYSEEEKSFSYEKTKEIIYKKVDFNAIKKFIEYHSGEACDVEKLHSILNDYFDSFKGEEFSRFNYNSMKSKLTNRKILPMKIDKLIEINKELDRTQNYVCNKDAVLKICYKETLNDINAEFDNVLDVVEEHDNIEFLKDGLYKIEQKYSKIIPNALVTYIVKKIVFDSFYAGNPITRKCFIKYFLHNSLVAHATLDDRLAYYSSVSLKALHFEHYGNNKENYSSITVEECHDFVLNYKGYTDALKAHPFDKDEYIDRYVKDIKGIRVLRSFFYQDLDENSSEDNYFIDYICNIAWKKIADIYNIEPPETYNSMVNMFYNYACNEPDEEYDDYEYDDYDDDEYDENDRVFEGEEVEL